MNGNKYFISSTEDLLVPSRIAGAIRAPGPAATATATATGIGIAIRTVLLVPDQASEEAHGVSAQMGDVVDISAVQERHRHGDDLEDDDGVEQVSGLAGQPGAPFFGYRP